MVLDFLAVDNFDFTRKIVKKKLGEKLVKMLGFCQKWIFGQKFDFSNSVQIIWQFYGMIQFLTSFFRSLKILLENCAIIVFTFQEGDKWRPWPKSDFWLMIWGSKWKKEIILCKWCSGAVIFEYRLATLPSMRYTMNPQNNLCSKILKSERSGIS